MASLEKTVAIIFKGDDRITKTLKNIKGGMGNLDNVIQNVAGPLATLGDGILKADAALGAMAVGSLAYAYAKSMSFESAVVELEKVVGNIPSALDAAKVAAFELSEQYGESSSDILLSTANFKQAGFEITDSLTLTKNALDLVIAGDMEAATASEVLIAALKGFKAPASEAGRLIDILNEVSNNYATNVEQLAIGMSKLSPIANKMGFSFEETAGVLTPVIEIFRSGDEASVALKTGLLKLIDDSKPVREALKSIGVSQQDANGNLRSGKDILFDVSKAFQTLSQDKKLFLTQQLVGINQAGRMVEVFDSLTKTTEITSVALRAAGSASKEVEARLASSEVQVKRFKAAFENLAITVGDQFKESANKVIAGGTQIENTLKGMVTEGTFEPLFSALNEFGDRLGDFLEGVAEAMPEAFEKVDWDGLIDSLGSLGKEISGFFGALDLTDPDDLARAIQGVVDTIESMITVTEGMLEYFKPMWDAIKESISQFNEMEDKSKSSFGKVLASAQMVVHAGVLVAGAMAGIKESGVEIENVFNVVVGAIRFTWNALQVAFDSVVKLVVYHALNMGKALELLTRYIPGLGDLNKEFKKGIEALSLFNEGLKLHQMEQMQQMTNGWAQAMAGFSDKTYKADDSIRKMHERLDALQNAGDQGVKITMKIDPDAEVEKYLNDKTEIAKTVTVMPELDKTSADLTKEALETALPGKKDVEIKPELKTDQLKKDTEAVKEMLESLSSGMTSTGNLLSDLFGELGKSGDWGKQKDIERQIRKETKNREQQLEMQKKLADAEVDYKKARTEALERGDSIITVQGDGLAPHLEAFMWEILSAIQVRANEDAAEFLLGVNG